MQHFNPTKKYLFIIGLLLATIGSFYLVVLAAISYRVNSGETKQINAWGVCKKVTNNNSLDIFVPTKTSDEWTDFRNNATYTSNVSLAECGVYCDEDGDGHYATTATDTCPSGRATTTPGDDCDDSCATCYPGSKHFTYSPDGLDQDCDGVVDNHYTEYGWQGGYDQDCHWGALADGYSYWLTQATSCPDECNGCFSGSYTGWKPTNCINCNGETWCQGEEDKDYHVYHHPYYCDFTYYY